MRKVTKISLPVLFIFAFVLCANASDAPEIATIKQEAVFTNVYQLKMWMYVVHILFFTAFSFLTFKFFQSWRRNKKLNDKMVHFIQAVYDIQKPLDFIKSPLEEISKEDNINETQKAKIRLAIWSTSKIQSRVNSLLDQEKSDTYFHYIMNSKIGQKNHLKEIVEATIRPYKRPNKAPEKIGSVTLPSAENQADHLFMEKLMILLKESLDDTDFTIDTLSQRIGMSRSSLYHRIKEISGLAPADFLRLYRLETAKDLLSSHQYTISEVAYKTGFSDVKYFRAVFKKQYKTSPGTFSKSE